VTVFNNRDNSKEGTSC